MPATPPLPLPITADSLTDDERLERFGQAIEALKARVKAEIGDEDVRYIERVQRTSQIAEVVGRTLLVVGFDPITYGAGVFSLFVHKQLEAAEIGHTVLHGAFDGLDGAEAFQSKGYRWKIPIDEDSWRRGHNARHHGGTNVAGRDPDIHFGNVRLTEETPHHWYHRGQLATSVLIIWPFFAFHMGAHFAISTASRLRTGSTRTSATGARTSSTSCATGARPASATRGGGRSGAGARTTCASGCSGRPSRVRSSARCSSATSSAT